MKKLISVMLLLACASGFTQETLKANRWVWVLEGKAAHKYIDPTTIRNRGDTATVWALWNIKDDSAQGPLSYKVFEEYSCGEPMVRSLALSAYADYFAEGMTLINAPLVEEQMTWSAIADGSVPAKLQKVLCGWD